MAQRQDIKQALVSTASAVGAAPVRTQVEGWLKANFRQIEKVIPKHLDAGRMLRLIMQLIDADPKLQQCTLNSLIGAALQSVRFGLEPGVIGECYIIPYKGQASFQLGYLGHVQLMHRSGMVSSIGVTEVCEHDDYDFRVGPETIPYLDKGDGDRGEVVGYFAYIKLKTGGYIWEYMTRRDIEEHRDKFSKSYIFSRNKAQETWTTNFDAMAKKTVLLRVMKLAPKSIEINEALFADGKIVTDPLNLEDHASLVVPEVDTPATEEFAVDATQETTESTPAATQDAQTPAEAGTDTPKAAERPAEAKSGKRTAKPDAKPAEEEKLPWEEGDGVPESEEGDGLPFEMEG